MKRMPHIMSNILLSVVIKMTGYHVKKFQKYKPGSPEHIEHLKFAYTYIKIAETLRDKIEGKVNLNEIRNITRRI